MMADAHICSALYHGMDQAGCCTRAVPDVSTKYVSHVLAPSRQQEANLVHIAFEWVDQANESTSHMD